VHLLWFILIPISRSKCILFVVKLLYIYATTTTETANIYLHLCVVCVCVSRSYNDSAAAKYNACRYVVVVAVFQLHSLLVFSFLLSPFFMWPIHKMFIFYTFHTHPRILHSHTEGARALLTFRPFFFFLLILFAHTFPHLLQLSWSGVLVGFMYYLFNLYEKHTNVCV